MKSIYTLFAAAAAMLAGCSDSDADNTGAPETKMIDVEISASGSGETRVSYDDRSMLWQSGDEVAVVVASQSATASTLTASTGGSPSTLLTGRIPQPADIDDYYAVYPADAVTAASDNGRIVSVTIPEQQGDTTKPILTAKCEQSSVDDLAMVFTPATAILDITVSQPVINVKFESCDGAGVAGEFLYDISQEAAHEMKFDKTAIEYLGGAGQTRIRMLVPPMSFDIGYKLTLTDAGGHTMVQSFGYHSGMSLESGKAYSVNINFVPISIDMGELKTTYGNYIARDLTAANDFSKRLTISGAGATVAGASSTMIEEVGYYFGEEKRPLPPGEQPKSFAIPDIEVASQGSYTVQAYALISGSEYRSAAQECIVTGLPLQSTPPTEAQGWTEGSWNTSWQDDYVQIGGVTGSGESSITYGFHIPGTINVSAYNKYEATGLGSMIRTTYTFTVGGATKISYRTSSGNTVQGENLFDDCSLSSSNNTVRCESSYRAAGPYCRVYSVIVTYR